jgi:hypothetical protein
MARSILDIIIKLKKEGAADKETVKGLVQVKSAMMDAVAAGGALVAAGYTIKQVFDQTVGVAVQYADQVRAISQVSRLSAEESSRLVQVTDDFKISQEDLLKVMQKNGDTYDYSIAGLGAMSDEYLSLTSSTEKAEFMQKRFGKSWGSFVELMEQGGKKIQAAGEGISDALVLDETALENAREYERQLDSLSDTVMAYKVAVGNELLPVLNDMMVIENRVIELTEAGLNPYEARRQAAQEMTIANMELAEGMKELSATTEANNAVTEMAGVNYKDIVGILKTVNDAQMEYAEQVKAINADESLTVDERKAKLAELGAEYEKMAAKVVAANMLQQMSADGLNQAEFERYVAFMEATGQMTAGAAAQAISLNALATAAADGTMSVTELKNAIAGLQDKTVNVYVNQIGTFENRGGSARGNGSRNAAGTHGFEPVPAGHPRDTFPVWVNSTEEYAVRPKGGGGSMASAGGGVYVNVTINSAVNTADMERAKRELAPVFESALRSAKAQGSL